MNRYNVDVVNYVVNCNFDDTNNNPFKYYDDCGNNHILSFYLLWTQVQVRISDDDCDHHTCDNNDDIHVIYDTVCDNHNLMFKDDADGIVNHHTSDSNYNIHVNNNTHIKNNDDRIYDNNDTTYSNTFEYSTSIDYNYVPTDMYWFDTDCDCYNNHNTFLICWKNKCKAHRFLARATYRLLVLQY